MLSTSAPATDGHLLDLLDRVRHHGQRAEGERRVRRLVHDDVVRDLVDERLALADRGEVGSGSHARTFTGPSPAPISTSPFRTASDATRAAPRAASSRDRPFASSGGERRRVRAAGAVRRRDVVALDLDLDVPLPVEEMVDRVFAVAAGDDHRGSAELVDPLGELAPRSRSGERLGLHQVRRDHRRERKQPVDERLDGVVLQQLRARARDHHRVDDERDADARRGSRRPCRSARARRACPSSRRRRRCPRRPPRAQPRRTPGGTSCTAVTPSVFCAVSATIALVPKQPAAANAFRSAWIPAPPPESEPAIVRHLGDGQLNSLRRHDPDQVQRVCSQPRRRGTPVGQGYHRPHGRRRGAVGRSAPGRRARVPRLGGRAGCDLGAASGRPAARSARAARGERHHRAVLAPGGRLGCGAAR